MKTKAKKWFGICLLSFCIVMAIIVILTWVIDPYFHFHKPFSFISYRLYEERYINDGISRHFDFDTVVTGTSMTQNFKTTEIDEVFDAKSVKEPLSGASFKELSENLDRLLKRRSDVKTVIWCIDYNSLFRDKDYLSYTDYPTYLYDDNIFNDVYYVFNREVLYHGVLKNLLLSLKKEKSTSMDEYSSWDKETGYEYVVASYDRNNLINYREKTILSDEEKTMVFENVQANIVSIANKYPDVTFYLYYSPYSICYWDMLNQENRMEVQFEMEEIATRQLLNCPNVLLFNFFNNYGMITNLDNYRDKEHYGANINSKIIYWLKNKEGLLTAENFINRLEEEKEYYRSYDYESIFRERQ